MPGGVRRLFQIGAAIFLVAAVFHAAAAVIPTIAGGTVWRHVLFAGIDGAFAYLLLRRTWWVAIPLAILTVQQVVHHGEGLLRAGRVNWIDLGVVVVLPVILGLSIVELIQSRR